MMVLFAISITYFKHNIGHLNRSVECNEISNIGFKREII